MPVQQARDCTREHQINRVSDDMNHVTPSCECDACEKKDCFE